MDLSFLRRLNEARAARQAAIIVARVDGSGSRLVLDEELATDPLAPILGERLRSGRSGLVETAEGRVLLTVLVPPPRLVMIGAVHVSQALAPMARIAGFDITIIDPRTAFATGDRFPGVRLLPEWPEDRLPALRLDAYTAVAALTHDPKIDDGALVAALQGGCFYIGALGSPKTHAKRVERLARAGISPAALARIHAPIGLPIGAQSPAEIAVAVLAEIVAALRSRGAEREAAA